MTPEDVKLREAATHRHKKRGTEYVLIGYGLMQTEDWYTALGPDLGYPVDMSEVVVYRSGHDGSLWVRPREEFEDGRFEVLREGVTLIDDKAKLLDEVERLRAERDGANADCDQWQELVAKAILRLPSGYGPGERGNGLLEGITGLRTRAETAEAKLAALQPSGAGK